MNWKKLSALALSLCIALGLCSCTPAGDSPSESPSASAGEPAPDYVSAFTQAMAGVEPDTVMFTVDGIDVTAEYYFYWLAYDCSSMDYRYLMYTGQGLDFSAQAQDGVTYGDYLKDDARKVAAVYLLMEREADAQGAGVTEEQKAEWEQQRADYIAEHGQDGYEMILKQQGVSEATFDRLGMQSSYVTLNLMDALYPVPTEAEQDAYIAEHDLLRCKHILIRTVIQNDDGTVSYYRGGSPSGYTGTAEDFNAAALGTVNDLLAQLAAADDPIALFDQLMNDYSEDTGLASYPDGYDFTAGTMHAEFEDGTRALEYNEYTTTPVETSDGYHIILRLRPDVADAIRSEQLSLQVDLWAETAFTSTAAYDSLDVKTFYDNYTAYIDRLAEEAEPELAEQ